MKVSLTKVYIASTDYDEENKVYTINIAVDTDLLDEDLSGKDNQDTMKGAMVALLQPKIESNIATIIDTILKDHFKDSDITYKIKY